jgi:hypothetical protein
MARMERRRLTDSWDAAQAQGSPQAVEQARLLPWRSGRRYRGAQQCRKGRPAGVPVRVPWTLARDSESRSAATDGTRAWSCDGSAHPDHSKATAVDARGWSSSRRRPKRRRLERDGGGEIRTLVGGETPKMVFETTAFNRSATPPGRRPQGYRSASSSAKRPGQAGRGDFSRCADRGRRRAGRLPRPRRRGAGVRSGRS